MTFRSILILVLTAMMTVLGGCAAPRGADASSVQQLTPTRKLIDAAGGEYEKFSEKLPGVVSNSPQVMRVIFAAHGLQPKDKWNPTMNFCVDTKRIGATHCLQAYATKDGTRLIGKTYWKASEGAELVAADLPFDLEALGEYSLDIIFFKDRLVMKIQDRQIMDHPTQAVPDEYWYSCSSVVCSVEVLYPYVDIEQPPGANDQAGVS